MTVSHCEINTAALALAADRNRQTSGLRAAFVSHRDCVMKVIRDAWTGLSSRETTTITLLGAGNCHDVDLAELLTLFSRVQLVDVDTEALRRGVDEQAVSPEAVDCFSPVDLAAPLGSQSFNSVHSAQTTEVYLNALRTELHPCPVPATDVVVSLCVLSQILDFAASLPDDMTGLPERTTALRQGHFARMRQILRPGGVAVFISDIVSSDSVSELLQSPPPPFAKLMRHCLEAGNFFQGLHPGVVLHELGSSASGASTPQMRPLSPWLWSLGPRRYVVYAVSFR